VPHVYGDAASHERFKPLVELRKILESCGVATVGKVQEFNEGMLAIVWNYLPHLATDESYCRLLEEGLQKCGIPPLKNYGLSLQALALHGYEDVRVVFGSFYPAPVRLSSADSATLSTVPVDAQVVERLATWTWWLSALEQGPRIELFKICLEELPRSWMNSTYSDSQGYRMPLFRLSDLQRFSGGGGDEMAGCLMEDFKKGVNVYVSMTFDRSSCWWPTALLNACRWSLHYMHFSKGSVDLEILGQYFHLLYGVSRQFRKEVLDMIVIVQENLEKNHKAIPKSFNFGKVDFRFTESVPLVVMPMPKWPFD